MQFKKHSLPMLTRLVFLAVSVALVGVAVAQTLSRDEVKKLTATAKTSADHMKLAKHYEAVAAEREADAKEHEALAAEYTAHPKGHDQKHPMSGETAAHCKLFAEASRKAAAEARAMAAAHEAMAKQDAK